MILIRICVSFYVLNGKWKWVEIYGLLLVSLSEEVSFINKVWNVDINQRAFSLLKYILDHYILKVHVFHSSVWLYQEFFEKYV